MSSPVSATTAAGGSSDAAGGAKDAATSADFTPLGQTGLGITLEGKNDNMFNIALIKMTWKSETNIWDIDKQHIPRCDVSFWSYTVCSKDFHRKVDSMIRMGKSIRPIWDNIRFIVI